MSEMVVNGISSLPCELLIIFAWSKLLNIRNPKLFYTIAFITIIIWSIARVYFDDSMRGAVSTLGTVLYYLLFPYVCSQGKPAYRVLILMAMFVAVFLAELLLSALWVLLTNAPIMDVQAVQNNPGIYRFVRVMHILVLCTCFSIIYTFSKSEAFEGDNSAPWLFVGFPATQLIILVALAAVGQYMTRSNPSLASASLGFFEGCIALCILCLVADVVLFVILSHHTRQRKEQERLKTLEQSVDWQLTQFDDLARDVQTAAQLRHDLSNQRQIVAYLAQQGDYAEARKHLCALTQAFEQESQKTRHDKEVDYGRA